MPSLSIVRNTCRSWRLHTDAVLRAVAGLAVDATTAMYAAITVFGYVRGVALSLEPEAQAEQDTGRDR